MQHFGEKLQLAVSVIMLKLCLTSENLQGG